MVVVFKAHATFSRVGAVGYAISRTLIMIKKNTEICMIKCFWNCLKANVTCKSGRQKASSLFLSSSRYTRLTSLRPIGQTKEKLIIVHDLPIRIQSLGHIGKFSIGSCSIPRTQFFSTWTSWSANNFI